LQVPATAFDTQYALELYEAGRRIGGLEDDPGESTYLWTGARVLQERRLVHSPFHCPDRETLGLALLERGPIAVGLNWYTSMDLPDVIDGRSVCHVDGEIRGGHAVLFNGISLDLELGGVRGFARFKYSWDRSWADQGQCLISLDDVERLMMEMAEAILAIPASEALTRTDAVTSRRVRSTTRRVLSCLERTVVLTYIGILRPFCLWLSCRSAVLG
jgi:hypothetical protein